MNKVDDKAKEALAKIMAEQAARAAKIEKLPPLLRQFYKRMGKAGRQITPKDRIIVHIKCLALAMNDCGDKTALRRLPPFRTLHKLRIKSLIGYFGSTRDLFARAVVRTA